VKSRAVSAECEGSENGTDDVTEATSEPHSDRRSSSSEGEDETNAPNEVTVSLGNIFVDVSYENRGNGFMNRFVSTQVGSKDAYSLFTINCVLCRCFHNSILKLKLSETKRSSKLL
jgi:hypothetical protein